MKIMILVTQLVLVLPLLSSCSTGKARKENPQYLRVNHAGSSEFSSNDPAKLVYERLSASANHCYATRGEFGMAFAGSIPVPFRGPGRSVYTNFDDVAKVGLIKIFVKGLTYVPMAQIDISSQFDGTKVIVYYDLDVELQRNIIPNVNAWLRGDTEVCLLNEYWEKRRKRAGN